MRGIFFSPRRQRDAGPMHSGSALFFILTAKLKFGIFLLRRYSTTPGPYYLVRRHFFTYGKTGLRHLFCSVMTHRSKADFAPAYFFALIFKISDPPAPSLLLSEKRARSARRLAGRRPCGSWQRRTFCGFKSAAQRQNGIFSTALLPRGAGPVI